MENLTMNMLFTAFFFAIAFDFITGIMVAWKNGKITSRVCGDGLFRTMGECILLLILSLINNIFPHTNVLLTFLAFLLLAFLFKEGVSITENLHQLGVWTPKWAKKALEICVEKLDSMEDKK